MARSSQDFSSKRHFHWTNKVGTEETPEEDHEAPPPTLKKEANHHHPQHGKAAPASPALRRKLSAVAVCRLKSVLAAFSKNRFQHNLPHGCLGTRVVGTLFGCRRGHVHFAFQKDPTSPPALLIELATPISGLVKEMASGLVRIALECDKQKQQQQQQQQQQPNKKLLEEAVWRTYCNGKKCGFATRKECGPKEWKVLKAVEPISMGAGVLPVEDDEEDGEQVMYMRAKFERIVGSRDSEAFYMMNPDSNGAPELSVYLLRV